MLASIVSPFSDVRAVHIFDIKIVFLKKKNAVLCHAVCCTVLCCAECSAVQCCPVLCCAVNRAAVHRAAAQNRITA